MTYFEVTHDIDVAIMNKRICVLRIDSAPLQPSLDLENIELKSFVYDYHSTS